MYKKLVLILVGCLFMSLAVARVPYVYRHHRHLRPRRRYKVRNINIKAGPIWNNVDAQNKCPAVCRRVGGRWIGRWHTIRYGRQSVCECRIIKYY